jgi:hypothetical protein
LLSHAQPTNAVKLLEPISMATEDIFITAFKQALPIIAYIQRCIPAARKTIIGKQEISLFTYFKILGTNNKIANRN